MPIHHLLAEIAHVAFFANGFSYSKILLDYIIPSALKNTDFQRASFREELRCRTLKEMTVPVALRLAFHENIPTQYGYSQTRKVYSSIG